MSGSSIFRSSARVALRLFHRFPQFFRIPPLPQTLSLRQLVPHCELSLKSINFCATIGFDSSSPFSPLFRRPPALHPAQSPRSFRYPLTSLPHDCLILLPRPCRGHCPLSSNSFRMRSSANRAHNSFRMRSSKNTALKVLWNAQFREN